MGLFDKFFRRPNELHKPHKPREFAEEMIRLIREKGEKEPVTYNADQFTLQAAEAGGVMNLHNIYQEYLSVDPADRPDALDQSSRTWFARYQVIPDEYEDARHDIMPTIRSRSYYDMCQLHIELDRKESDSSQASAIPYQVVGEHLGLGLVYDLPDCMQSINQTNLDEWDITLYEIIEAANENLNTTEHVFGRLCTEDSSNPESDNLDEIRGGLFVSCTGDNYDASRMMLPEMIGKMPVQGDPIAMIPNRDSLMVTGSEEDASLRAMLDIAKEKLKEESRPISGCAFRFDGEQWNEWLPERSSPLYDAFYRMQVMSLGSDYSEQKTLLDKLHEKQQRNMFVASFSAVENSEGELMTYCVWPRYVSTLMPRTELVALSGETEKDTIWVRFDDLMQAYSHDPESAPRESDYYPVRYETGAYPSGEAWDALLEQQLDI